MKKLPIFALLFFALQSTALFAQEVFPVPNQFITLSANGKYLVNSFTNKPIFITGEDGFLLPLQISDSDVDTYLQDRAAKGFNVIWVGLIDAVDQRHAPKNHAGRAPFDGPDFANFDEPYWAHIDSVVERAQAHGITLAMSVAFVDPKRYRASLNHSSDEVLAAYGKFLGNRYKNFPNIIWVLGGDADPKLVSYANINKIGTAIAAADPNHLMTLEASRDATPPDQSTITAYGGRPPEFINLNWAYNTQSSVVEGCQLAFAASLKSLPPLMGEDWYELEHSMTGFQTRQEGYWATLSGCYLGRIFGNGGIWSFSSPNEVLQSPPAWKGQLNSEGSVGQEYLGKLMRSREHWLMVPDIEHKILTAGFGSGPKLSLAARSSDGQTIIAYFSDGSNTPKSIDMTNIVSVSSTVNAWWYNPRTGTASFINKFPNVGTRAFTAPDGNDWVLVLDDAGVNLQNPGVS